MTRRVNCPDCDGSGTEGAPETWSLTEEGPRCDGADAQCLGCCGLGYYIASAPSVRTSDVAALDAAVARHERLASTADAAGDYEAGARHRACAADCARQAFQIVIAPTIQRATDAMADNDLPF